MREILFRGKRLDNGKWVYSGSLVHLDSTDGVKCNECFMPEGFASCQAAHDKYDNILSFNNLIMYKVDVQTIGQFTGIRDKNGKPIFEGDLLKTDLERPYNIVIFRNGCFLLNCNDGGEDYVDTIENLSSPDVAQDSYWEVIGNIYDNKELCKKQ